MDEYYYLFHYLIFSFTLASGCGTSSFLFYIAIDSQLFTFFLLLLWLLLLSS